jgi:hypothetical protein
MSAEVYDGCDRRRESSIHTVNTPKEGIGLHRLNELIDDTDALEVRVDPDEHDADNPMCGEWVRIEYIQEWGTTSAWGRTPDNQFLQTYESAQVLVINDEKGAHEATLSRCVPSVPHDASDEYEFNIREYYSGGLVLVPWEAPFESDYRGACFRSGEVYLWLHNRRRPCCR